MKKRAHGKFLKSRLGTRIAILFILCALVPIATVSVAAFVQVIGHLKQQTNERLREESKALGMSVIERLTMLEKELTVIAARASHGSVEPLPEGESRFKAAAPVYFSSLVLVSAPGKRKTLAGRPANFPDVPAARHEHLADGRSVVFTTDDNSSERRVFMVRAADPLSPDGALLYAEINMDQMWSFLSDRRMPGMAKLWVLDEENSILYSNEPVSQALCAQIAGAMRRSSSGRFDWEERGREYYIGYWSAYMKHLFDTPRWTVAIGISKDDVFAPIAGFKRSFPLVVLLSFWVVLFLTLIEVRRSMGPLSRLMEGTRKIARKDFNARVNVVTKDEFQDLADSFNGMAETLGRQFNALTTISEIDRAVLSSLNTEEIVRRALGGLHRVFTSSNATITLVTSSGASRGQTYSVNAESTEVKVDVVSELEPEDLDRFRMEDNGILIPSTNGLPPYLKQLVREGIGSFLVMPITLDNRIEGTINLGLSGTIAPKDEDLTHLRQLADQVAVAISNANLVKALNNLNWGTLRALARTVDAKSPWTSGHSERVTHLALKIAAEMGFDDDQLEELERGALLHDIGKIGISATILDKPDRLTDEEYRTLKEHTRMGRRILEPIDAYAHAIKIVLQHHEKFDGTGYPDGIAGEEINLGARIVAVADVCDAMATDRPYRKGLPLDEVRKTILDGSGSAFDPTVVHAFLRVAEGAERIQDLMGTDVAHPEVAVST